MWNHGSIVLAVKIILPWGILHVVPIDYKKKTLSQWQTKINYIKRYKQHICEQSVYQQSNPLNMLNQNSFAFYKGA